MACGLEEAVPRFLHVGEKSVHSRLVRFRRRGTSLASPCAEGLDSDGQSRAGLVQHPLSNKQEDANMITERSFASSFPDFWQELLPLLTPSCVHLLNAGHEEHLHDASGHELGPVETHDDTRERCHCGRVCLPSGAKSIERGLSVNDAFVKILPGGRRRQQRYTLSTDTREECFVRYYSE